MKPGCDLFCEIPPLVKHRSRNHLSSILVPSLLIFATDGSVEEI